jgi:predicted transcriptional regulator
MIKATSSKLSLGTGTAEEFFVRGRERARKLDSGEKLAPELRMTFEDPADLVRVLTAERIRVLSAVREQPRPIAVLATQLRRDRTAVRRDVRILESFGLVRTRERLNPGHGRMRVVEPLAKKYQLTATL